MQIELSTRKFVSILTQRDLFLCVVGAKTHYAIEADSRSWRQLHTVFLAFISDNREDYFIFRFAAFSSLRIWFVLLSSYTVIDFSLVNIHFTLRKKKKIQNLDANIKLQILRMKSCHSASSLPPIHLLNLCLRPLCIIYHRA